MQIVIDIPDEIYERAKVNIMETMDFRTVRAAIFNGTPLPEHHGDLKDADVLKKEEQTWDNDYEEDGYVHVVEIKDIDAAPTIIPATETPTESDDDKYVKVPACNGYTFYVPKQKEKKEEMSCETCIRQDDDPISGECYECVKGIIDHYEPATEEGENE